MRTKVLSAAVLATSVVACSADSVVAPVDSDLLEGASSATALTSNIRIPIVLGVFIPCAAGGAGEVVLMSGNLHLLNHLTLNANGGFTLVSHAQPQGIRGNGLTTGDKYQGVGKTRTVTTGNAGSTTTFVNTFSMIGAGPGNNATVQQNIHMTVNANGDLTANVSNTTVACR